MGKPLKNPPVYFTVVQVRFNAILNLKEKYLPQIQDGLRKAGFPVYEARQAFALQLEDAQAGPKMVPVEQYFFLNPRQTHGFVLAQDALTFQSSDYGYFEVFSEAFLKGVTLVNEAVELAYTQRIGLRYLDFILPKDGDSLEQYVHPGVFGMSTVLGGHPLHAFTESLSAHGDVRLRSRILLQDGGLAFPPDVQPDNMTVHPRFRERVGRHAILDTDGYFESREDFSVDNVKKHLDAIHLVIGGVFRSVTTVYANKVWEE